LRDQLLQYIGNMTEKFANHKDAEQEGGNFNIVFFFDLIEC